MAYNSTPHDSTRVSPHKLVFGEEMLHSLALFTDTSTEQTDPVQNETEYVKHRRSKMKVMLTLVRENLQNESVRQKKAQ